MMQEYEQRLRRVERRATLCLLCGLLCVIVASVLLSMRPAISQPTQQQTVLAPFRVVDTKGEVLFEVVDNVYGGKMVLYARKHFPIVEAATGEMTTVLTIRENESSKAYVGANTKSGFITLKSKNKTPIFHAP